MATPQPTHRTLLRVAFSIMPETTPAVLKYIQNLTKQVYALLDKARSTIARQNTFIADESASRQRSDFLDSSRQVILGCTAEAGQIFTRWTSAAVVKRHALKHCEAPAISIAQLETTRTGSLFTDAVLGVLNFDHCSLLFFRSLRPRRRRRSGEHYDNLPRHPPETTDPISLSSDEMHGRRCDAGGAAVRPTARGTLPGRPRSQGDDDSHTKKQRRNRGGGARGGRENHTWRERLGGGSRAGQSKGQGVEKGPHLSSGKKFEDLDNYLRGFASASVAKREKRKRGLGAQGSGGGTSLAGTMTDDSSLSFAEAHEVRIDSGAELVNDLRVQDETATIKTCIFSKFRRRLALRARLASRRNLPMAVQKWSRTGEAWRRYCTAENYELSCLVPLELHVVLSLLSVNPWQFPRPLFTQSARRITRCLHPL